MPDGLGRTSEIALTGTSILLRPVRSSDYDFLLDLHTTGRPLVEYRFRGFTPSPDQFLRTLWEGVVAQFTVTTLGGAPVGLVTAYSADFRNGHARLAGALLPNVPPAFSAEAFSLFVDYVFRVFDFRKLYGEVLEFNFAQFESGLSSESFEIEGRLKEHEYHDGKYWDLVYISLFRDDWQSETASNRDAIAQRAADLGDSLVAAWRVDHGG